VSQLKIPIILIRKILLIKNSFKKDRLNYFAKSCSFCPIFSATSFAISVVIFDPMLFAPLLMLDTT
jgi:hypothetical protein